VREGDRPPVHAGGLSMMEDDCWSIEALRDVNSLAASIALKKNLIERSNRLPMLSFT